MVTLSTIQIVSNLETAFNERQSLLQLSQSSEFGEECDNAALIGSFDQSILQLLHSLIDTPAERWVALCTALESSALLACATSYCNGFELSHLEPLVARLRELSVPLNKTYNAAQFINLPAIKANSEQAVQSVDDVLSLGLSLETTALLLSAFRAMPIRASSDRVKNLHPDLSSIVAYKWATTNFSEANNDIIRHWQKRENSTNPASFWALLALVAHDESFLDQYALLETAAYDDQTRAIAALARQAYDDGSFSLSEALQLASRLHIGETSIRMRQLIRLVMWFPVHLPLVELTAPTPIVTKLITALRQQIENIVSGGENSHNE